MNFELFSLLYDLKGTAEYKKDFSCLNFHSLIQILEADVKSRKGQNPLSLLNREFGKYLSHMIKTKPDMTYHQLGVIQKALH